MKQRGLQHPWWKQPWSSLWVALVEPGHPSSGSTESIAQPKQNKRPEASAGTHVRQEEDVGGKGNHGHGAGELQSSFAEGRLCQRRGWAAMFDPGDGMDASPQRGRTGLLAPWFW